MGVYYIGSIPCSGGDIYHFGRKGMKWGQTIFGDLADRLAKRGWGGASRVARGISTGFGRANEFINADFSRNAMNRGVTQARSAYNRTLPGMIDQARGAVGNAASAAREQAQQAMADARAKVSTAYADAAAAIGKKGLDIQSFYSQVMQKAQGAINQGKNMVSKYGGQFVSQIQTLGNNALAGGKAFLEGIMKKAKQAKSKATEPISRLKARKAEKRDAEYDVGHKDTHARQAARANRRAKDNRYFEQKGYNDDGYVKDASLAGSRRSRDFTLGPGRNAAGTELDDGSLKEGTPRIQADRYKKRKK